MTVDRINFLRRTITVDRQLVTPPKGEPHFGPVKRAASDRVVPMPAVVADALALHLQTYCPGPDGLIFTSGRGEPIRRPTFSHMFRRAGDQIGIAKGDGFHELRHHYASLLISSGCSVTVVQRRLGHATAQETLDTYPTSGPTTTRRRSMPSITHWSGALVESSLNHGASEAWIRPNPLVEGV